MSINFLSGNTTRHYTVPDSTVSTLPDFDWFILLNPKILATVSNPKYMFSTGAIGNAGAINIFRSGGASTFGIQVGTASLFNSTGSIAADDESMLYATRRSGQLYLGWGLIGGSVINETAGQAITGIKDGGILHIGARSGLSSARFYNGKLGLVAVNGNRSVLPADIIPLLQGLPFLSSELAVTSDFILTMRTSSATLKDIVGGKIATRVGTGFGTDELSAYNMYPQHEQYINIPLGGGGVTRGVQFTWQDKARVVGINKTGLQVLWYDEPEPRNWTAPKIQISTGTTNGAGLFQLDIDAVTSLSVGGSGYLHVYELNGVDSKNSALFSGSMPVVDIT